jgi:tetratricopeptide (TPR) repeat protein
LGADHPNTLTTLCSLARAYQDAGQLERALPLFEEAASGMERLQFQHEHAAAVIANTARAYEAAHQFGKAENWLRKWLAVVKTRAGAESSAYARALAILGLNLLQQKKWSDADAVLRECLALRAKLQPEAWTTFYIQSMLGDALVGQHKYAEAEPLLRAGYEGMQQREKTIPPQGRACIPNALAGLVGLYDAWGKPDEAAKWRKLLAERLTAELLRDYAWPLLWGRAIW